MSKAQVLAELLKGALSGEKLSQKLGISRAAVWKAVESLRADGFVVASAPGRGYELSAIPDILLPELIERGQWRVSVYDSVDSTNNVAKTLCGGGAADGTVLIAGEQTGGRGRLGRTFFSPRGGLYMSIILRPEAESSNVGFVTSVSAIAVCRAIERCTGIETGIKWTNDIIINNKKTCGILSELSIEGESGAIQYMIIGIGLNCSFAEADFPEVIRDTATSLKIEGADIKRYEIAGALLEEFAKIYTGKEFVFDREKCVEEYRRRCLTLGKRIKVIRGSREEQGFARDITEDFGLVVEYPDGRVERVTSGEVSVRGMYGYSG